MEKICITSLNKPIICYHYIFMKNNYIFWIKNLVRSGFVVHFANIFYVWSSRRRLGSHTSFCIQSVAISHVT